MKKILFLAIGTITCIVLLIWIFILTKQHTTKALPSPIPISSKSQNTGRTLQTQPTGNCAQFPLASGCGVVGTPINICSKQYPNYPPRSDILTTKDNPNLGVYTGTISKLDEPNRAVTVTSDKNGEPFLFNGGAVNGKIYDIHHSLVKYFFFYTLKSGMKVVVSFPCSQRLGIFKLNQFQIVQ